MSEILTIDDIRKLKDINLEAVKFYLRLAEERLNHLYDVKDRLEQKALILFGGYVVAGFALFGLAERFEHLRYWLNGSALFFCAGVVFLFLCIRPMSYGARGRHPEDWLGGDVYLKISRRNEARVYAYALHDHIQSIDLSRAKNELKTFYLKVAIGCGALSMAPFAIKFIYA